jgi:hypothetical protein
VVRRVAPRPDPDPDRDPFGSDFDNVVFSHEEVVMATPPRVRRPRRRRGGGNVAVVRRDLTPRLAMSRERWDQLIAFGLANGWIDSAYGVRWPFMNTYIVESTGYVGPVVGPFVVPVADVEGVVWRVGTVTHTMFNGFICCVQFAIGDHLYYVMVEVADGFVTAGAYVGDKSFGVMLNPQGGRDLYGFSVTN